jgi:transposase-like protein
MSVKNKYVIRSRISEAKFRQIILLFSEDLSATQISHLTKLSKQTINKYLTAVRLGKTWLDKADKIEKKNFRVHHSKNEFARGNSHINGIESFWGYAKNRLVKFKGMNKSMFDLHLKECDF